MMEDNLWDDIIGLVLADLTIMNLRGSRHKKLKKCTTALKEELRSIIYPEEDDSDDSDDDADSSYSEGEVTFVEFISKTDIISALRQGDLYEFVAYNYEDVSNLSFSFVWDYKTKIIVCGMSYEVRLMSQIDVPLYAKAHLKLLGMNY